ncbi:MAG TPA: 30S ribosomal protein S4 [Dehalococcoidia bacterium]|jgi:small subunit ribosomal protein S4|nr:30S ribosomal protein S4 [Dehalococcoidia bacterium]
MARYTGPVCRICRRYGEKLMLKGDKCVSKCTLDRRPSPPGEQKAGRRRKLSDRALQLREKQKARYSYGVLEKQFVAYYEDAVRRPGVTGQNLVRLLEMRLDNVVHKMGFADSLKQARQLVRHGHIVLNGRRTDVPSAATKAGDTIGWHATSKKSEYFKVAKEAMSGKNIPAWLNVDREQMTGRVVSPPAVGEVPGTFDPAVIVEYYSR